jgi:2-oxoglutarate dehydrogenase complex dehydrogenase (E1) component-like enzyme
MNQGAYQFARLHLDRLFADHKFNNPKLSFIGRPSIHSFATGAPSDNKKEAENIWKHFDSKIIH